MDEPVLLARVARDGDGRLSVLAPKVGWWSDLPEPGALLGAGSRLGYLSQLTRRFALVRPDGAAGRVTDGLPHGRVLAVEYGQRLFRLAPLGAHEGETPDEEHATIGRPARAGLAPGSRAVVSPTDGVFYRRPSPDEPPFVEVGTKIRSGQPIALVEVMKTFNQILYEGPGLPEQAEVLEIRCADAEEVRAGQILIVIR